MADHCVYRRSVVLPATPEAVFRFHEDPHNIPKISPAFQRTIIGHANAEARVGETFAIEVRLFGVLTLRWLGFWEEIVPGRLLVDGACQAPFAYWRHRHEFAPVGAAQTRMNDQVTYRYPGGWLGYFFGATLGRLHMALMFADRHRRTRRYFQQQSQASPR